MIYTIYGPYEIQHMSAFTKTKCVQSKFASEEKSEESYLEIFTFNLKNPFDNRTNKGI